MIGIGEILLALAIACVAGTGLWLALGRDLIGIVVGLALVGSAANLFLFAAGRVITHTPPLIPDGASTVSAAVANPLPQALVLTAIVIGFALACYAIALVLALARKAATGRAVDADALRHMAPPARPDGEPERLP